MRGFLFCLVAGLATQCFAQDIEPERGWYLGGGATYTTVGGSHNSAIFSEDEMSGATGFVATGGYRLADIFAVEINYIASSDVRFTTIDNSPLADREFSAVGGSQDTRTVMVTGLAIAPLDPIELFAKAGAALWDASSDLVLTPSMPGDPIDRQVSASGTNFVFGVGAGLDIGENAHLRFSAHLYGVDEELFATSRYVSINEFLFELHWRF